MGSALIVLAWLGFQIDAPAPPVVIVPGPAHGRGSPSEPIVPSLLDIRVTAGTSLLWEGSLRTGRSAAVYRNDRSEAPAVPCPMNYRPDASVRSSFMVSITRDRGGPHADRHEVSVNWSRPSDDRSCDQSGIRRIELKQTPTIAPGDEVTLSGDAGLRVWIRRRPNP